MEWFDSAIDAVREVKKLSKEMGIHDKIYFAYNEYCERYAVADDNDDLSDAIHQKWCDNGCDSKPEHEAESYKILEYSLAANKEHYPRAYSRAKRSLIRSEVPLIRRSVKIECEYSVNFAIGY